MAQFKALTSITWNFDSDLPKRDCLEYVKQQLESILDTNPHGPEFDGFSVQVNVVNRRTREKLVHLGEIPFDEVFPHLTKNESRKVYSINGKDYHVRMNSDRYFVFRDNPFCVSCGLEGTKLILDLNPGDQSPHFNLYAEEKGRLILMTKDHILAKSQGGQDEHKNYATMCSICNNLKCDTNLTKSQVHILRQINHNEEKLPRKELKDLIQRLRQEMVKQNAF